MLVFNEIRECYIRMIEQGFTPTIIQIRQDYLDKLEAETRTLINQVELPFPTQVFGMDIKPVDEADFCWILEAEE